MKGKIRKFLKHYTDMIFMDSMGLIKKCGLNIVLFEMLYKLGAVGIFYPLFLWGTDFTMKKAGFRYLTNSYIFTYLKSPYTIIFILLIIIISGFYITYEVACLSVCFDAGYHSSHINILGIFRGGFKIFRRVIRKKTLNGIFHVVSVVLMINGTMLGYWLSSITLPNAARNFFGEHKYVIVIAAVVFTAFFIYCMFNIFVMNFMAYDGRDISESKKKSHALIKKKKIKTFGVIFGWNIIIFLGIYAAYLLLVVFICLGVLILDKSDMGMAVYLSIFRVVITVVRILLIFISVPVSYGVITGLFYRYRCDSGYSLNIGETAEDESLCPKENPLRQRIIAGGVAAIFLAVNIFYLASAFENNPFGRVEIFSETQIMAHRGCSYNAPENTMMAFENAVDSMADYIELDVHETKEGVIVVMHDSGLKRTTGVNRQIWNVEYDEIKDLDAGSWFGDDEIYAECRIPTLRDVIEYTKGKVKLNIEIKLSDREPDLVKSVVELIQEYELQNECYVTSMNYEALKEVKRLDSSIQTGYVLTMAYGSFYNIDNVDAFSISSAFVNKSLVDAVHNRGKKIFVWTVNSSSKAKQLTGMGVDAIITDNPVMAREVVYDKYSNTLIKNVLSYVFDN